jgi:hypothetical protein
VGYNSDRRTHNLKTLGAMDKTATPGMAKTNTIATPQTIAPSGGGCDLGGCPHIDENLRKIYALLGGIVDILEGSNGTGVERCPDLPVSQKLDWKRVFGLHLWFGRPMDASIAEVFDAYDNHF